jgi:hypothetical protein
VAFPPYSQAAEDGVKQAGKGSLPLLVAVDVVARLEGCVRDPAVSAAGAGMPRPLVSLETLVGQVGEGLCEAQDEAQDIYRVKSRAPVIEVPHVNVYHHQDCLTFRGDLDLLYRYVELLYGRSTGCVIQQICS